MHHNAVLAVAIATALSCSAANAAVELIATGNVSGSYEDYSVQTAAPLESGIAGNRLGGMGSALAYAGCNTFVGLPDRGPNATVYNALVDSTTSYVPRFHTLHLSLAPSDSGAALPYVLTAFVTDTTLLSSPTRLFYGDGARLRPGQRRASTQRKESLRLFHRPLRQLRSGPSLDRSEQRPLRSGEHPRLATTARASSSPTNTVPTSTSSIAHTGQRLRTFTLPANSAVHAPEPAGRRRRSAATPRAASPTRAWKAWRSRPTAGRWSAPCRARCCRTAAPTAASRASSPSTRCSGATQQYRLRAHQHRHRDPSRSIRPSAKSWPSTVTSSWSTSAMARAWATTRPLSSSGSTASTSTGAPDVSGSQR